MMIPYLFPCKVSKTNICHQLQNTLYVHVPPNRDTLDHLDQIMSVTRDGASGYEQHINFSLFACTYLRVTCFQIQGLTFEVWECDHSPYSSIKLHRGK